MQYIIYRKYRQHYNINELLKLRVDASDLTLKTYLKKSNKNALYMSHRMQNELLECYMSSILRLVITNEAMQSFCFALLMKRLTLMVLSSYQFV
jgi:hypothetical protein